NLLVVKTNDDLIVIEDYLQINHDRVFKNFNKKLSSFNLKKLANKNLKLEKDTHHKKANITTKVLCYAALTGVLMLPLSLNATDNYNNETNKTAEAIVGTLTLEPKLSTPPEVIEQEVVVEEVKVDPEEEYFKTKVKEYSDMYFIDYDKALALIEENKYSIENDYTNEEVGIIRVLAEEFYNNSNINKAVEVSDISSLEREKLLLSFAIVHGIDDIDTAATILAIHRLETGNGKSEACINKNNFGGLRAKGNNGYYVMSFKTPEIGAEAMINSFIRIQNRAMKKANYNPNRPLEQNINSIYCGEPSWPGKVKELKNEVMNDYNLSEYVSIEKPKILIKLKED
ncbi:MAG: hypothetical protein PHO63_06420, partial [Bacilli bacterium]|nr:hypothetical protein [Bacilli bacterium]